MATAPTNPDTPEVAAAAVEAYIQRVEAAARRGWPEFGDRVVDQFRGRVSAERRFLRRCYVTSRRSILTGTLSEMSALRRVADRASGAGLPLAFHLDETIRVLERERDTINAELEALREVQPQNGA